MPIGYLHAGDTFSDATAVTPDGNTIVGSSRHNYDVTYAYRWTAATGMVQLQLPPASFQSALAFGVSADGRYVIGAANGAIPGPDYTAAVRWDEHGSYEGIPFIPDYDSGKAYGITPDGRTIVGEMGDSEGGLNAVTAFIWREGAGTMFLADYLRDQGLDIPQTTYLYGCQSVSADGTVFVGKCFDTGNMSITQGFVAVLPPRCHADFNKDGGVDGGDVEAFFSAWENSQPEGDVNNDGGIDGMDVERFFIEWEAGGCE